MKSLLATCLYIIKVATDGKLYKIDYDMFKISAYLCASLSVSQSASPSLSQCVLVFLFL